MTLDDPLGPVAAAAPVASGEACHYHDCPHDATNVCQRCGERYCAAHLQPVTLERRSDAAENESHQRLLARVPTSKTTYLLCAPCRKKPLDERLLHPGA